MDLSYQSCTVKVYNKFIPNHFIFFFNICFRNFLCVRALIKETHIFDTHINIKRDHLMSSVLIEKNEELVNGRII